jgi:hypothetical protein
LAQGESSEAAQCPEFGLRIFHRTSQLFGRYNSARCESVHDFSPRA